MKESSSNKGLEIVDPATEHRLSAFLPAWVGWLSLLSLVIYCTGHMIADPNLYSLPVFAMIAHGALTGIVAGARISLGDWPVGSVRKKR